MKARSIIEGGIKESSFAASALSADEKKIFNKIKRNLMRTFVNPNHSVKMVIDLAAMEYIRYFKNDDLNSVQKAKLASSVISALSELDLTPRSKKAGEVSTTLSQIFKTLNEGNRQSETTETVDSTTGEIINGNN